MAEKKRSIKKKACKKKDKCPYDEWACRVYSFCGGSCPNKK